VGCNFSAPTTPTFIPDNNNDVVVTPPLENHPDTDQSSQETAITEAIPEIAEMTPTQIPAPPTPDPYSQLYGCEMELLFHSGPLEGKNAVFTVLGKEYFNDKGDKFDLGKGTSVYYEGQRYFILHSSYIRGNILKPMEAEFIRKYLEYWGTDNTTYIETKINDLIGSEAIWVCNGKVTFKTRVTGAVRLSHQASERLWLIPGELEDILREKEGLSSEWVGGIEETDDERLYLGFCGWGPDSLGEDRYTYYRYLVSFEVSHSQE